MMTLLVLLIGSLTSFSVGEDAPAQRLADHQCRAADLCDPGVVPGDPVLPDHDHYGLHDNPWSVIAALVTFATPYAIFIFQEYGRSIPLELDESARIDGASPVQVYFRIYLPLMAPALVAVGTYALLLAWNEYLYQFLLLSNKRSMTVPVALAQFINSDRGAVELHDGDRDHLCPAAGRDLLCIPPPHVLGPHHGRRQGLTRGV